MASPDHPVITGPMRSRARASAQHNPPVFVTEPEVETSGDSDSDNDDSPSGGARLDASPYRPPHLRAGLIQSQSLTDNYGTSDSSPDGPVRAATDGDSSADRLLATRLARVRVSRNQSSFQVGSVPGEDLFGSSSLSSGSPLENFTAAQRSVTSPLAVRPPSAVLPNLGSSSNADSSDSANQLEPYNNSGVHYGASRRFPSRGTISGRPHNRVVSAIPAAGNSGSADIQSSGAESSNWRSRLPGPRVASAQVPNQRNNNGFRAVSTAGALRPSTSRHMVGDKDVQAHFPDTACLFVANLPEDKSDDALEAAVTQVFAEYGTVFVKIRRSKAMPFAFAQYTKNEEARAALDFAQDSLILGRPCRVEVARGNRPFIVRARDRSPVTIEEAKQLLRSHGPILSAMVLPADMEELLKLGPGVLVQFAEFDPHREFNHVFKETKYYVSKYEPEKRVKDPAKDDPVQFLQEINVAQRSIFVKPLPLNMTEARLKEMFEEAGDVVADGVRINFDTKPYPIGFVEFARIDMPDAAIKLFHGRKMNWGVLRVERKHMKGRNPPPLVRKSGITNFSNVSTAESGAASRRASAMSPRRTPGRFTDTTPLRRLASVHAGLLATAPAAAESAGPLVEPVSAPPAITAAPPVGAMYASGPPPMMGGYNFGVPGVPPMPAGFPPHIPQGFMQVPPPAMPSMHGMQPFQHPGMPQVAQYPVGGFQGFPFPPMTPYPHLHQPAAFHTYRDPITNMYYTYPVTTQPSGNTQTGHALVVDGTTHGAAMNNGRPSTPQAGSTYQELIEAQSGSRPQGGKKVSFSSPLVEKAHSASSHE